MVVESMIKQGRDPFKVEKTFMEKKGFGFQSKVPESLFCPLPANLGFPLFVRLSGLLFLLTQDELNFVSAIVSQEEVGVS